MTPKEDLNPVPILPHYTLFSLHLFCLEWDLASVAEPEKLCLAVVINFMKMDIQDRGEPALPLKVIPPHCGGFLQCSM